MTYRSVEGEGGGVNRGFEQLSPMSLPPETQQLQKLQGDLKSLGFMAGELVKRVDSLGRQANILVTGPSASNKSVIIGILRHLIESSGFETEKMKEGKVSALAHPGGRDQQVEHVSQARVILWESTIVLPVRREDLDLYVEVQGSIWKRIDRLDEKMGSLEFAQLVGGAPPRTQRIEGREPDLILDTDAMTIQVEQSGWVTRQIEAGWRQSLTGTNIPLPSNEENTLLQSKLKSLSETGLGEHLTQEQIGYLAIRLIRESLKNLPDGRCAIYIPRINLILGERVTSKIPVERVQSLLEGEELFAVSDNPQSQRMGSLSQQNTWLIPKRV